MEFSFQGVFLHQGISLVENNHTIHMKEFHWLKIVTWWIFPILMGFGFTFVSSKCLQTLKIGLKVPRSIDNEEN